MKFVRETLDLAARVNQVSFSPGFSPVTEEWFDSITVLTVYDWLGE